MKPLPGIIALLAGIVTGMLVQQWPNQTALAAISLIDPLGDLWLSALQMLFLPLVVSLLVLAVGKVSETGAGRTGATTLLWMVMFLSVAATLSLVLGSTVLAWWPVGPETIAAFQGRAELTTGSTQIPAAGLPGLGDWLRQALPTNLLAAATQGDFVGVMMASVLFGFALRYLPAAQREPVLSAARIVSQWCQALAMLLLRLLPAAVFILSLRSAASFGADIALGLVYYIFWVCALLVLAIALLYPVTALFGGTSMLRFASGILPVQVLAFSCRSSLACLPAMLSAARERLQLREATSAFVLPFAVSSFKLNMGISANFQMLFLLHVYGIQAEPAALIAAAAMVTAQSVATPGLPSGAIWTTTPVYLALGVPLEGIVLTNVVDTIPDLFKTTTNVSGNLSIATIVAHRS